MIPYIPRSSPYRTYPPAEISETSVTKIGRHSIPGIEIIYLGDNKYRIDFYIQAGQSSE